MYLYSNYKFHENFWESPSNFEEIWAIMWKKLYWNFFFKYNQVGCSYKRNNISNISKESAPTSIMFNEFVNDLEK